MRSRCARKKSGRPDRCPLLFQSRHVQWRRGGKDGRYALRPHTFRLQDRHSTAELPTELASFVHVDPVHRDLGSASHFPHECSNHFKRRLLITSSSRLRNNNNRIQALSCASVPDLFCVALPSRLSSPRLLPQRSLQFPMHSLIVEARVEPSTPKALQSSAALETFPQRSLGHSSISSPCEWFSEKVLSFEHRSDTAAATHELCVIQPVGFPVDAAYPSASTAC